MNKLYFALLAIVLVALPLVVFPQYDFMKYGRIDEKDLKMTIYPLDSAADAVVLGDYGNVYFDVNERGTSWIMYYDRHVRIKIFNKNAYDYANISIPLYNSGSREERILTVKGATYYLENGEVVKESLSKDNIFKEVVSERLTQQKFAMPAIREGCIIEYQYTKKSDYFFNLETWNFQWHIPVVRSEFNARVPKYFNYNPTLRGYLSLSQDITDRTEETFLVPYRTSVSVSAHIDEGKYELKTMSVIKHWIMNNVPAFHTEPFMSHEDNFISSMSFELASYTFEADFKKKFTDSWESINSNLLEDEYFGDQLKNDKFLNVDLSLIKYGNLEPEEKVKAVYEWVKSKIKWNKKYSIYSSSNLSDALEKNVGNSADINLILILALRYCELDVTPVVLSTRDNGVIIPSHPSISHLNHVIAKVNQKGKYTLLDATEPTVPVGFLPENCLNGRGYEVQPGGSSWLPLDSIGNYTKYTSIDMQIGENGKMKANLKTVFKDYAAIEARNEWRKMTSSDMYAESLQKKYSDADLSGLICSNADSIYSPFSVEYSLNFRNGSSNDMCYVSPFPSGNRFENHFNREEREHPIDFIYPRSETFIFKMNIPAGYEIAEKPTSVIMTLPDKSVKVSYTVNYVDNVLQIMFKYSINRSIYQASEYGDLKALFTEIVKKQTESIVLRKKA